MKNLGWLFRFIIAIAITGTWIWFSSTITGQKYEFALHDAILRWRGPIKAPSDIVIVALDEPSYDALRLPMDRPIPRSYHAKLLKRLAELGAKRVVYDVVFAGRSASEENDLAFSESISGLPVFLGVDHGERIEEVSGREIYEIIKPDPLFASKAAGLALVGLQLEDGVSRHFFLKKNESIKDYITLSEAGAGIANVKQKENIVYPKEGDLINFYGKAQTIKTISLYQVLEEEVPIPKELIKNKIVYIGLSFRTGLGATEKDSFQTPFGDVFGVEIHATQAANILEQNWFRSQNSLLDYILGALIITFVLLILLKIQPQLGILILACVVIGWFAAAYIAVHFNLFLAGGSAVTAFLPLAVIGSATSWYITTHRRSMEIEKAFSLYLAPAMVSELKKNPDLLKLGGEEIVATAMFTDIAGFTGISEKLGAAQVTAMLNAYFTEIGQAVLEEEGTLIKFIGDAVFAIWGAPLPQSDHAARACRAAMKIQQVVDNFNNKGMYPKLATRVGVHTGKMVVGNLGSNKRFDFTAIGDAVNLSSRVEGVNKYLGTTVLVTDDALEAAEANAKIDAFKLRIGAIKVIGREVPVSLFRFSKADISEEIATLWRKSIALFSSRRWELAKESFIQVKSLDNSLGVASDLYLENIERYNVNPPGAGWKGELEMEHK